MEMLLSNTLLAASQTCQVTTVLQYISLEQQVPCKETEMLLNVSSAKDGATDPLTDNITGASMVCCQEQAFNGTLLSPPALDKISFKCDWVKSGAAD